MASGLRRRRAHSLLASPVLTTPHRSSGSSRRTEMLADGEAVSAGLRLLETEATLRAALEGDESSGIAECDAFDRVRRQLGLER